MWLCENQTFASYVHQRSPCVHQYPLHSPKVLNACEDSVAQMSFRVLSVTLSSVGSRLPAVILKRSDLLDSYSILEFFTFVLKTTFASSSLSG
jgi:hypothetical protein